jgi:hypothetical protein
MGYAGGMACGTIPPPRGSGLPQEVRVLRGEAGDPVGGVCPEASGGPGRPHRPRGSTIWLVYKQVREACEELPRAGRVNPKCYGTRWEVADLPGPDHVYELERRYGAGEAPRAGRQATPPVLWAARESVRTLAGEKSRWQRY